MSNLSNRRIVLAERPSDPEWGDAQDRLAGWAEDGQLKAITNIWGGLDTGPAALVAILAGENVGQVVVRVRTRHDFPELK